MSDRLFSPVRISKLDIKHGLAKTPMGLSSSLSVRFFTCGPTKKPIAHSHR